MKQTIIESMFINEMKAIRPDNFSYEGLQELFSYLDEIDSDLEFDPIAICCDFSQCSLREFKDAFPAIEGIMIDEGLTLEDSIQYYIEENGYWFAFVEGGQEIVFNNF
jgi:secreted Zn-dependent insulinase-like peptidase